MKVSDLVLGFHEMDGREPGNMVIGPSSYGAGATNSSIATENWTGMMHELQISYSSMCRFKQVDVAGSLYQGDDLSGNAPMKKMRGRPDGTNSLASTPSSDSGYSKSPGSDPTAKHLGQFPGSAKRHWVFIISEHTVNTPFCVCIISYIYVP